MTTPSEDGVRAHLARIERDRMTIEHERHMLDSWAASLDREERLCRRALEFVDESGQTRLINPTTMRPYKQQARPEHRAKVMEVWAKCAPAYDRQMPQIELERHTGLSSGSLSRAMRDLEAAGTLRRAGKTGRGSPIWTDQPETA
jgi:hypothetical protein